MGGSRAGQPARPRGGGGTRSRSRRHSGEPAVVVQANLSRTCWNAGVERAAPPLDAPPSQGGVDIRGQGGDCGHSLERDHASVSPMRWPRHIPWTTLPSGLARHQWKIGHSPRMRGDSTARSRADLVSSYPVSGIHPYDGSQEMEPPGNPVRFIDRSSLLLGVRRSGKLTTGRGAADRRFRAVPCGDGRSNRHMGRAGLSH